MITEKKGAMRWLRIISVWNNKEKVQIVRIKSMNEGVPGISVNCFLDCVEREKQRYKLGASAFQKESIHVEILMS